MPGSSKEFLDIEATKEYGFTLKRARDMRRTYGQMHRTDNILAKCLFRLRVEWFWVPIQCQLLKLQILRGLRASSSLTLNLL